MITSTDVVADHRAAGRAFRSVANRRRADAVALLAGLMLGASLLLSYGLAPLGLVALAVAVATAPQAAAHRRRRRLGRAAGVRRRRPLVAGRPAGHAGAVRDRSRGATAVPRLPRDLARSVRPGARAGGIAGLARLRERALWVLPGSALGALVIADLSGLSKGETERIWLPFAPWLLLATAALRAPRRWLAAQLALAIALQAAVRSPW